MTQIVNNLLSKISGFIQARNEAGKNGLIAGIATAALTGATAFALTQQVPQMTADRIEPPPTHLLMQGELKDIFYGEEIFEVLKTIPEADQFTFLNHILLLSKGENNELSILQAFKTLQPIPVEEQKELIELASPLLQFISDSSERAKMIEILRKTSSAVRKELIEDATLFFPNVPSHLKRSLVLKTLNEIPVIERRNLIRQADPLLKKLVNGYDRARILKFLRALSPAEQKNSLESILSLLQDVNDPFNQEKIVSCLIKIQAADLVNVINHALPFINSVQNENEIGIVVDALTTSYAEKVIVPRKDLISNPAPYIHQAVSKTSPIKIHFLGENGADGGGLWREFVSIASESTVRDNTLFLMDKKTQFAAPNSASTDYTRFKEFGQFMGLVIKRGDAVTGPLFQEAMFRAMLAFTPEELDATQLSDKTKFKITEAFSNQPIFHLLVKETWTKEEREIAEDLLGVSTIQEGRADLFKTIPIEALRALAIGVRSQIDLSTLTPDSLMTRLQGVCDCAKISGMIQYNGTNPSVQDQTAWLKEWVAENPENSKAFLCFTTGNKALPSTLSKIEVMNHDNLSKYPTAQTCINTIYLSTQLFKDKKEFVETLQEAIASSPDFGQK